MESIASIMKTRWAGSEKDFKLFYTAEEIEKMEIPCVVQEPEAVVCKHCNNTYRYMGKMSFFKNEIAGWSEPRPCQCPEAVKVQEEDRIRIAAVRLVAQKHKEELALKEKIESLFSQSKMGERFKTRTFENYIFDENNVAAYSKAKSYANNFKALQKDGTGIMFIGNYGTGKTHLAAAITNDLINKGIPVVFGTLVTLLGAIKNSWDGSGYDEWEITELYRTVDLLVIDDLGKERVSEWTLEKLYSVINDRYENFKPVIITTNFNDRDLIKRLTTKDNVSTAESIVSRLIETCSGITLNGEDYRRK